MPWVQIKWTGFVHEHCVVFLVKKLFSHSASLSQVYKWVLCNKFNAGGNPVIDQHTIQARIKNTPCQFMLQKPEKASA